MKVIDEYLRLQKEIFEYFGYTEDWVKIPIDDARELYWRIIGSETNGSVQFSSDKTFQDENQLYENEIYTQRFLSQWVYRGKDFTMICVDTHTDGNRFLQIFDNSKEQPNES